MALAGHALRHVPHGLSSFRLFKACMAQGEEHVAWWYLDNSRVSLERRRSPGQLERLSGLFSSSDDSMTRSAERVTAPSQPAQPPGRMCIESRLRKLTHICAGTRPHLRRD